MAACAAVLLAGAAGATEPPLEEIMGRLAASPGLRARFVEVRTVPILQDPVETRGRLAAAPPDFFARSTEAPNATRLVLRGDELRLEGTPVAGDVAVEEGARRVAQELRAVFRGDLEGLRQRYELEFRSAADGWILRMVPREAAARRFVAQLVLRGSGDEPVSLELFEADGGHALLRLHDLEADRALSVDEWDHFEGEAPQR